MIDLMHFSQINTKDETSVLFQEWIADHSACNTEAEQQKQISQIQRDMYRLSFYHCLAEDKSFPSARECSIMAKYIPFSSLAVQNGPMKTAEIALALMTKIVDFLSTHRPIIPTHVAKPIGISLTRTVLLPPPRVVESVSPPFLSKTPPIGNPRESDIKIEH